MTHRAEAPKRSEFPVFTAVPIRWNDVDRYGHVNNAVHYEWFDTAVNAWLMERSVLDPQNGETVFLVAETGCSYFREILFGQDIQVGLAVERLGNSSVIYRIGIFADDADKACALGRFVHVLVDRKTRLPTLIRAEAREVFSHLQV